MGLLDGQVAFITGGARGLGRAMVQVFCREGAKVAFNYRAADGEAAALVEELRGAGHTVLAQKADVTDKAALRALVKRIEAELGGIDVLVNNAGVGQVLPLVLMEEEDRDRMMDTHVKGAFLATQAVLRGMVKRRAGHILNISSLAGVRIIKAPVHYCTAKAALRGFTEGLAKEIGHYGIRVNALAPGLLDEGVAGNIPDDNRLDYERFSALGRVGTCAEVAEVAAMLVARRNTYMTGATILLDGGA
jgi:NAD(P)-dependent dehydrogenase (short-subunit alcohol dehydrogenase family)